MSDEPSDAQKLIADVHRVHVYDVRSPAGLHQCECGYVLDDDYPDMVPHISAEIDKALGGLTRKRRIDYQWRETGEVHHDRFFEGKPVPKTRLHYVQQSRWASGWTVTE